MSSPELAELEEIRALIANGRRLGALTHGEVATAVAELDLDETDIEELLAKAQSVDAQVIVVGSRGLGAVRAAIGSVTLRLLHQAPCPVLVAPSPKGK